MPVVSMMKNGLPPARSAISAASASSMRRPEACRASSTDSAGDSGSRRSRIALPVPVPARAAAEQRRAARARTSTLRGLLGRGELSVR
jgi:hypothetical protein